MYFFIRIIKTCTKPLTYPIAVLGDPGKFVIIEINISTYVLYPFIQITVELQWLEHLWDHGILFDHLNPLFYIVKLGV